MARVNGPLMSMDASGALGGAVVFSKWKGRNYVRQLVKPANPRSGGQISMRAALKFLAQEWAGIGDAPQATWEDLADAGVFSPFNAFTKFNLKRNRDFLAPFQSATDYGQGTASPIDVFTATPGVRSISVAISDTDAEDTNWGYLLFRSLGTGFTPAFSNLHAVVKAYAAVPTIFIDTPLEPDTYYYDVKPFNATGKMGALDGEINGVVA